MDRRKRAIDAYRRARDGAPTTDSPSLPVPSGPDPVPTGPAIEEPAAPSGRRPKPAHDASTESPGFEKTAAPLPDPGRVAQMLRGSGPQRAARLLIALGSERAAEVMRSLAAEEVEAIAAAIVSTGAVRRSELDAVLAEAVHPGPALPGRGGPDVARRMLIAAFGEEEGERRFFRSVPNAPAHHFAFLNDLEPTQLHAVVKDESSAACALIIAHVDRDLAAGALKLLPAAQRGEVARRIARMGKLSREVVVRVEEAVREKIRRQGRPVTQGVDGPGTLAAILRHMSPTAGDSILGELRAANLDLGESVRQKLYTTELLLELSDRHLADLLREFSDREVALFLKGKDEGIRARVLRTLSERRGASVSEEYVHLGAQARGEVDRVTREVLERLRELEEDGTILVPREGDRYI